MRYVYLAFFVRPFEGGEYLGLAGTPVGAQDICQESADSNRRKGERKQLRWWDPVEGMDRIWVGSRTSAGLYEWKVLEQEVPPE